MRAFILPLRLALAVFGTVALSKLMPAVVRGECAEAHRFPPPVVQCAEFHSSSSWQAISTASEDILMPVQEERDLEKWLGKLFGSARSQPSQNARTPFTYPEPNFGYEEALSWWEESSSARPSQNDPSFGELSRKGLSTQAPAQFPKEDYYTLEYWNADARGPQPLEFSREPEPEYSQDDYPVPVIEEDPQPVSEEQSSDPAEMMQEDVTFFEDAPHWDLQVGQEEEEFGQEEEGFCHEDWDPYESGEQAWLEGEECYSWQAEQAMQDTGKATEEFAEDSLGAEPGQDTTLLEETGGIVLLDEPAETWRWYDFRGREPDLEVPSASLERERLGGGNEPVCHGNSMPQGEFSGEMTGALPESYDPWCYYGYRVHEIMEDLGVGQGVPGGTTVSELPENPASEDPEDWFIPEEAMVLGDFEHIQSSGMSQEPAANTEWTTSPVFDWDTSVDAETAPSDFESAPERSEGNLEEDTCDQSPDRGTSSEGTSEFEPSWEFSEEPWSYRSPWDYPGADSEELYGGTQAGSIPAASNSSLPGEIPGGKLPEAGPFPDSEDYFREVYGGEIFDKGSERVITGEMPSPALETAPAETLDGAAQPEELPVQEGGNLCGEEPLGTVGTPRASQAEPAIGEVTSQGDFSYEYEYWPYSRKDSAWESDTDVPLGRTEADSPDAAEDFCGDQGLGEDDLYWYRESSSEKHSWDEAIPYPPADASCWDEQEGFDGVDVPARDRENRLSISVENLPESPAPLPEERWEEVFEEGHYPFGPGEDPSAVTDDVGWHNWEGNKVDSGAAKVDSGQSPATHEIPAQADMDWYDPKEEGFLGSPNPSYPEGTDSYPEGTEGESCIEDQARDRVSSPGIGDPEDLFWSESSWQIAALREQYGRAMGIYPATNSTLSASDFAQDSRSNPQSTGQNSTSWQEPLSPNGISLFAETPAELLTPGDLELLKHLRCLQGESLTAAATYLDEYLSTMGWHVYELTYRAEAARGVSRVGLARDPVAVSLLLAACRLVEKGELGMEEAGRLLEQSLRFVPEGWATAVGNLRPAAGEVIVQLDDNGGPSFPPAEAAQPGNEPDGNGESQEDSSADSGSWQSGILGVLEVSARGLWDAISPLASGMTKPILGLFGGKIHLVIGQ